jgi:hypothetical protein
MVHPKSDRSELLCSGCSPYDPLSTPGLYRNIYCPSCCGQLEEREFRSVDIRLPRAFTAQLPAQSARGGR